MMSKLTARGDEQNKQFKPKIYQGNRRGQLKHFYDNIIVTREIIRIDTDHTEGIGEFHSVVGYNVNEITEIDQNMSRTTKMTLEGLISEGM